MSGTVKVFICTRSRPAGVARPLFAICVAIMVGIVAAQGRTAHAAEPPDPPQLPAPQAVRLEVKFPDGAQADTTITTAITQTIHFNGNEHKTTSNQTIVVHSTNRQAADSTYVDFTVKFLKASVMLPGYDIPMEFDTHPNNRKTECPKAHPENQYVFDGFKALSNTSWTWHISKASNVGSVEIRDKDELPIWIRPQLQPGFVMDRANASIEVFHNRTVSPGLSWVYPNTEGAPKGYTNEKNSLRLRFGARLYFTERYEYQRREGNLLEFDVDVVDVRCVSDTNAGLQVKVDGEVDIVKTDGIVWFDCDKGRVVRRRDTLHIKAPLIIPILDASAQGILELDLVEDMNPPPTNI